MTDSRSPMPTPESPLAASITDGLPTLSYMPDGTGEVTAVTAAGWQPVNEVNYQAWQEINQQIAFARQQVIAGRYSCLYYYMIANQMQVLLLARYTGQAPWLVYCHLRPFFFRRLGHLRLTRYASIFQVTVDDLQAGRLLPPVYQRRCA